MAGRFSFVYYLAYWLLLTCMPFGLYAQELPIVKLKEVEISVQRISDFAVGASASKLDSGLLAIEHNATLADIIRNFTGSHVKSYGNGMLSSISFRGTGPEHTAVLWHGINIAYPMLGQSDLSLLPIAFNDQIIIQQGTGASLYGSGALGGTIAIGSTKPRPGTTLNFSQYMGSYGTYNSQVRANYANDKFFLSVRGLWNGSKNDFKYQNTTRLGEPIERQQNAAYKIAGVALESGVQISEKSELQMSGQYTRANRNLQPSMNTAISNTQDDENGRLRLAYHYTGDRSKAKFQYAFLTDNIAFNTQTTTSQQQVVRGEFEQNFSTTLKISLVADHTDIKVFSPFYSDNSSQEYRSNIWVGSVYSAASWLLLSVNMRQGFHPVFTAPLTPSLGAEFYILDKNRSTVQLNMLMAKGFRLPTLNELYWEPGGNLNLVPEESYSVELGVKGTRYSDVDLTYTLTGYRMWVDDWILWQPTGTFWSPINIKKVDVFGLEASGSLAHQIASTRLVWSGTYAMTHSINRTSLDNFDRSVNKQLSYVPIHKGNITAKASYKSWSFILNTDITGKRYTTADNESSLPAYALINFRASKSFELNRYRFTGNLNINNLLNTTYQSVVNKAMPGTNFLIGITFSYHKP